MSLLHQNQSYSVRDYLFLAVGLLGLFGFFMMYGSQDTRSIIDTSLDKKSATMKAAEVTNSLGFSSGNYETKADYGFNNRLLDSLQYTMGRQEFISLFKETQVFNLYPYYWEVRFDRDQSVSEDEEITIRRGPAHLRRNTGELVFRLTPRGEWIELANKQELLPDRPINRDALRYAFKSDSSLSLWSAVPDSSWNGVMSFDLENGYEAPSPEDPEIEESDQSGQDNPHQYTRDEVLRLAAYHINMSAWDLNAFAVTDIQVERVQSVMVARVNYTTREPVLEQNVTLQAAITSTGSLLELSSSYSALGGTSEDFPPVWDLLTVAAVFLFGLGSVIIFYFRIRARVVDTRSALVICVLTGFIVPLVIFLNEAYEINFFGEETSRIDFVGLALNMGIVGALASVGFFVVSAISDSITRQYWPEKLRCYDYLRQGMFFNKPVGETLVRSVILTFIVAGIWSALLWLFPNLFIQIKEPFLTSEVIWPPIYLILDNIWYSLIVVMGIFLVLGSQVYAQTRNSWMAGTSMVLATALILPLPFSMGPAFQQFLLFLIFGLVLTLIFLRWDFLTLFLTHFLFTCLLVISSGWIVEGSPDLYVFISFILFLLFIVAGGTISIVKGKEEQVLSKYVPEYVEELAQEERIKQELQIARDVQQSFLPAKTPDITGLDIAALCRPAYETGGDYYDFIRIDDHRIALAIGDVSGKGIQAAFYMTFTKGILHSLCRETSSPAELLIKANRLFCDNAGKGTFISLVYGIVDLQQKTFTFARAGHNPVIRMNSITGKVEELQPVGLGLGLTKEASFGNNIREIKLTLNKNDLLVLYTDGIVEALNEAHQFYGNKRLVSLLQKHKEKPSPEILSALFDDVTTFIGRAKQHDDMTALILRLDDGVN